MAAPLHKTADAASGRLDCAKKQYIAAATGFALLIFAAAVGVIHYVAPQVGAALARTAAGVVAFEILADLAAALIAFAVGTDLYWRASDAE